MRKITLLLLLVFPLIVYSQAPSAGNLVKIHEATSAERNSITGAEEGMLIYDSDEETIYTYTATNGWHQLQVGPSVYVGTFIISSAGSQSITGLPFQPSQITFAAHANIETYNLDVDNNVGNNTRGLQNAFGNMTGFARDDNGSITQQFIYTGSNGNSINDISRYASNSNCIGIRYSHQNGDDLGKITASLSSFDEDGFTINATYTNGLLTDDNVNPILRIQPDDVLNESIVVIYTAYR